MLFNIMPVCIVISVIIRFVSTILSHLKKTFEYYFNDRFEPMDLFALLQYFLCERLFYYEDPPIV